LWNGWTQHTSSVTFAEGHEDAEKFEGHPKSAVTRRGAACRSDGAIHPFLTFRPLI
jgi:hypothetical protein